MNARTITFEFAVEEHQIEEVCCCIFQNVLFHRTGPKYTYNPPDSEMFTMGAIGFEDVDLKYLVPFTYVRVNSRQLNDIVRNNVAEFSSVLRSGTKGYSGQIVLEFYEKINNECRPWEVWNIKIEIVSFNSEREQKEHQDKMIEMLRDKILYAGQIAVGNGYVPELPVKAKLDSVYDTTFRDIQPYLFKVYSPATANTSSVGKTLKKLVRDTLSMTR